jgi:carbonic anhydrase/acetyltransferase-like protein (isoleucine patch superfamily)
MDYYEWFDKKVNPVGIVNGDLSIREFGAIVHRATLRGDISEKPLTKCQKNFSGK